MMSLSLKIRKVLTVWIFGCLALSVNAKEITVSAAASLNNAFKEVAQQYEAKHSDVKILLNFGASGALLQQIDKGAPVDVFASADQETMDQAVEKKLIQSNTRQNFIDNSLVLITPMTSKIVLSSLKDLNNEAIKRIAIGNPTFVPAGRYTQSVLSQAELWKSLQEKVIYTQNVRQALDYVARGEVAVGFVYGSDVSIMSDKVKVMLTVPTSPVISYPIAVTVGTKEPELAKDFIAYVLSDDGQAVLVKYGFFKRVTH